MVLRACQRPAIAASPPTATIPPSRVAMAWSFVVCACSTSTTMAWRMSKSAGSFATTACAVRANTASAAMKKPRIVYILFPKLIEIRVDWLMVHPWEDMSPLRSLLSHDSKGTLQRTVAVSSKHEISCHSPRMYGYGASFHFVGNRITGHSHHRHEGLPVSKLNGTLTV